MTVPFTDRHDWGCKCRYWYDQQTLKDVQNQPVQHHNLAMLSCTSTGKRSQWGCNLECCDRLSAVLHQVAKLINLSALIIKPKGCRPECWLWGRAGLPIRQKPWLQGVRGYRGADCWWGCLLGSCRCCFGSWRLNTAQTRVD